MGQITNFELGYNAAKQGDDIKLVSSIVGTECKYAWMSGWYAYKSGATQEEPPYVEIGLRWKQ